MLGWPCHRCCLPGNPRRRQQTDEDNCLLLNVCCCSSWPVKLPSISVLAVIRFPLLTPFFPALQLHAGLDLYVPVIQTLTGNSYRLHFNPSGDDGNVVIVWRPKPWELPAQEKPNHSNWGLKLDEPPTNQGGGEEGRFSSKEAVACPTNNAEPVELSPTDL